MNLRARHLSLIFVLINFHSFSFSTADSTGNLLNTNTFKEFNLLLSKDSLPWVPSVLLLINSSSVKKYGSSFTAHLCRSFSLLSANWTPRTLFGVTQALITSSPTGVSAVGTCLIVADVGVAGISELSRVAGAGGTVDWKHWFCHLEVGVKRNLDPVRVSCLLSLSLL